jgi:uncharacterized membrane protein
MDEQCDTRWAIANFAAGLRLILLGISLFLLVASAWMGFSLTGYVVLIVTTVALGAIRGVTIHRRDRFWHPSFAERTPKQDDTAW